MEGVNKVEQQVDCMTCQWNKMCVDPPSMTEAEVKEKVEKDRPTSDMGNDKKKREGSMIGSLMTAMMFAGKDKECRACSVFIARLREGPELTTKIKQIMKEM